ncbi:sortase [Sphaerisporangium sp. NPDC049003]|uniref:sortase n=1 Tax=Sphaerisporangium sp. NPDC049003 TaxID=3364517 RepID=UPI0037223B24
MTPLDTTGGPAPYAGAMELADQAIQRLEEIVSRVSGTGDGTGHANALVLAGSASVLLGQLELTVAPGDGAGRASAATLRSRYDTALLALGSASAPARPPAPQPYGAAPWVQVAPGQWAQLAPPAMVPPFPGMPPGYGPPAGYGMPGGHGMPPGYGPPAGYPAAPVHTAPSAYGIPGPGVAAPFVPQAPATKRRSLRALVDGLPPEIRRLGGVAMTGLTVMGALLVAFSLYGSLFGHLTYERNQRVMIDQLNEKFKVAAAIAAAPVAGDKNLAAIPARDEPIALLEIPGIGVREAVVQGTGTAELRSGVGHYRPSPMPGQVGNAVLAGHRNLYGAPLARITELKPGDKVAVTTQEGRFTYTVETTMRARTGEQDFLSQATTVNRLTLLTTSDGDRPGGRLAVVARLDGQAASLKTHDDGGVTVDELGLGRDPSAWWPTLGWGAVFFGVLSGTLVLYRRWRRTSTYLITTPALMATALIWFEALARLIPSTF